MAWPRMAPGVSAAGRLGFDAVEAFASAVAGRGPDTVAAWLEEAGLELSALYLDDLPADPAAAAAATAAAVPAAAALGCGRLVASVIGPEPAATAAAAGAVAAAARLRFCLHPHRNTGVETAAQTEAVLAVTDPSEVWVCADTGHLLMAGDDPAAAIVRWAPRLAGVHLKDVDGTDRVVAVGSGRLGLRATLAAVDAAVAAGAPLAHVTIEMEDTDDPDGTLAASLLAIGRSR